MSDRDPFAYTIHGATVLLTLEQAAGRLSMPLTTIDRLVATGAVPSCRMGLWRCVDPADLARLFPAQFQPVRPGGVWQ